jgi:hypothetical protein
MLSFLKKQFKSKPKKSITKSYQRDIVSDQDLIRDDRYLNSAVLTKSVPINDCHFDAPLEKPVERRISSDFERPELPSLKDDDIEDQDEMMNSFDWVEENKYNALSDQEWKQVLEDPTSPVDKNRIFVSLQEGVSRKLRRRIWLYLAKVETLQKEYAAKGITYKGLLQKDTPVAKAIEKDVSRTFPEYEMLRSATLSEKDLENQLTNILTAYANFDPEIGYTQGMNFLAATLLHHMDLGKIEKDYNVVECNFECEVFWVFVYIMREKDWRRVYMDGTPKLMDLLKDLDIRMKKELPKLHNLLINELCLNACFSQCYLTLLCYNSPLSFAKRVLDMFLLEGESILTEILMKMLGRAESDILIKRDMELVYPFLRKDLVRTCYEQSNKTFSKFVTLPETEKYTILENVKTKNIKSC